MFALPEFRWLLPHSLTTSSATLVKNDWTPKSRRPLTRVTGRPRASGEGVPPGFLPGAQPSRTPSLISVRPASASASRRAWDAPGPYAEVRGGLVGFARVEPGPGREGVGRPAEFGDVHRLRVAVDDHDVARRAGADAYPAVRRQVATGHGTARGRDEDGGPVPEERERVEVGTARTTRRGDPEIDVVVQSLASVPPPLFEPTRWHSRHAPGLHVVESLRPRRSPSVVVGAVGAVAAGALTAARTPVMSCVPGARRSARSRWAGAEHAPEPLATVIDIASCRVVGWSTADRLWTDLVADALRSACRRRRPRRPVVFRSDRGCQYTSQRFATPAGEFRVRLPVGRTGRCWDNALAEPFFATIERELLDTRPWPSRAAARTAIFDFIEGWYNLHRLHSSLGHRGPAEHGTALAA
ncbi:DDE-type integrase/transposase/recombinase [Streptomyces sp. NPDC002580]|uniref:DDE-type integrase/transposase/recombinase n=1 Tax=Streptomyces sp. NPDC002580 TaxID=3364653 RepID=UPI0036B6561A